jgi:hypothetical protein
MRIPYSESYHLKLNVIDFSQTARAERIYLPRPAQ